MTNNETNVAQLVQTMQHWADAKQADSASAKQTAAYLPDVVRSTLAAIAMHDHLGGKAIYAIDAFTQSAVVADIIKQVGDASVTEYNNRMKAGSNVASKDGLAKLRANLRQIGPNIDWAIATINKAESKAQPAKLMELLKSDVSISALRQKESKDTDKAQKESALKSVTDKLAVAVAASVNVSHWIDTLNAMDVGAWATSAAELMVLANAITARASAEAAEMRKRKA